MADHSKDKLSEGNIEDVGKRYFLPRNVEEAERMQNQHEWLKGGADGLILAPIDLNRSKLRVLDAATADGMKLVCEFFNCDTNILQATGCRMPSLSSPVIQSLLALIMRKSTFPSVMYYLRSGSHSLPQSPEGYPPLDSSSPLQIVKQDLIEEFPTTWKSSFDFVHQRFVIPLFKTEEVPLVLRNLIGCMKPGGWIQLVEMDFQTPVSKPIESCPAVQAVHKLTSTVVADPLASTKLAGRLTDEGLVNVGYKAIEMVAGSSHPNPALGERGQKNMLSILGFFQSVTK